MYALLMAQQLLSERIKLDGRRKRRALRASTPSFDLMYLGLLPHCSVALAKVAVVIQTEKRDSRAAITQYTGTRKCVVESPDSYGAKHPMFRRLACLHSHLVIIILSCDASCTGSCIHVLYFLPGSTGRKYSVTGACECAVAGHGAADWLATG